MEATTARPAPEPGQFKVPKQFAAVFEYLVRLYAWDAAEVDEIKTHVRRHAVPMVRYWSTLATAHRAGYEFSESAGFERLEQFCWRNGLPGPRRPEITVERTNV